MANRRRVPTRKERKALQIDKNELFKRFLQNGYTCVPNFVMDKLFVLELPTDFPRFFLTLWRQTIGYGSDSTTLSMRALQEFARSRNRTAVSAYIKAMELCGLLAYEPSPSPSNDNGGGQKRSTIKLFDDIGDPLKILAFLCALRDVHAKGGVASRSDFDPKQFAIAVSDRFARFLRMCRSYDSDTSDERACEIGLQAKLSMETIREAFEYVKVYGA